MMISNLARPGRANRAEYGFWLIFTSCTADAVTPGPFASMPFTTKLTPFVPVALSSRNRDIVVM